MLWIADAIWPSVYDVCLFHHLYRAAWTSFAISLGSVSFEIQFAVVWRGRLAFCLLFCGRHFFSCVTSVFLMTWLWRQSSRLFFYDGKLFPSIISLSLACIGFLYFRLHSLLFFRPKNIMEMKPFFYTEFAEYWRHSTCIMLMVLWFSLWML